MTATAPAVGPGALPGLVRLPEWWGPKVGPLVAVGLGAAAVGRRPPDEAAADLLRVVASGGLLGAAAHVLNDLFDGPDDRRIGRDRPAGRLPPAAAGALAGALAGAGLRIWRDQPLPATAGVALAAIVGLPVAYSAPPLRLKDRGGAGVAADAALAHVAPTVFAVSVMAAAPRSVDRPHRTFLAVTTVWSLAAGVRGIVSHQLADAADDAVTGTDTWVRRVGPHRARRAAGLALGLEVAALVGAAVVVGREVPGTALATGAVTTAVGVARLAGWWQTPLGATTADGNRAVLWKAYRVWPALAMAVGLVGRDRRWLPAAALACLATVPWASDELASLRHYAGVARHDGPSRAAAGGRAVRRAAKGLVRRRAPGLAAAHRRRSAGTGTAG